MAIWLDGQMAFQQSLGTPLPESDNSYDTRHEENPHRRASRQGLFHPALWTDVSVSLATRSALKGLGRGAITLWL